MTGRATRKRLEDRVEDLEPNAPDSRTVVTLPTPAPSDGDPGTAPREVVEWWRDEADRSRYTVPRPGDESARVPVPDFLPGRGVVVTTEAEMAATYARYSDEHRAAERQRREADDEPVPAVLDAGTDD